MRIQIEGNIAAGKSTLLKNAPSNVFAVMEAISRWRNPQRKTQCRETEIPIESHNLLDLIYKEPKKYMCEFQLMVQEILYEAINSEIEEEILVVERSFYSSQYIFTVKAFNDGNVTYKELTDLRNCGPSELWVVFK
jgi:deoxyadenosine/deoxycytidine kinase